MKKIILVLLFMVIAVPVLAKDTKWVPETGFSGLQVGQKVTVDGKACEIVGLQRTYTYPTKSFVKKPKPIGSTVQAIVKWDGSTDQVLVQETQIKT